MDSTIGMGLMLLVVGMITVFVILSLVVIMGNLLIRAANYFLPEPTLHGRQGPPPSRAGISPSKMAAIIAAVDQVTQGKGKITHIEKQE